MSRLEYRQIEVLSFLNFDQSGLDVRLDVDVDDELGLKLIGGDCHGTILSLKKEESIRFREDF